MQEEVVEEEGEEEEVEDVVEEVEEEGRPEVDEEGSVVVVVEAVSAEAVVASVAQAHADVEDSAAAVEDESLEHRHRYEKDDSGGCARTVVETRLGHGKKDTHPLEMFG